MKNMLDLPRAMKLIELVTQLFKNTCQAGTARPKLDVDDDHQVGN